MSSPDPKRRKQSSHSYRRSRSPSPTRARQGSRRDDRRSDSRYDDHRYSRDSRDSYYDRNRDDRYRSSNGRHDTRYDDYRSRDRPRDSRKRSRSRTPPPAPVPTSKPTAPSPATAPSPSTPTAPSTATAPPSADTEPLTEEEKKKRERQARLAEWKQKQKGSKALDVAKDKAAKLAENAVAAKLGILPPSVPAKPALQLNRAALGGLGLKGLPVRPGAGGVAASSAAVAMDDFAESGRKLIPLEDMPAVDLTLHEGTSVGENLEVDEEEDDVLADVVMKDGENGDEDEDEVDPLDAFMSGVKQEVKKVNAEDKKKLQGSSGRLALDGAGEDDDDEVVVDDKDEIDTANMRPEDILALAAKKVKKKDLAVVDHAKMKYEPFRKEFYRPSPEVDALDQEDVDLLRLALDGIKIRGVDCPKPVTKWSHCGLPAATLEVIKRLGYTGPTSIQAQAIPAIMSGRDVIGVAKTGSGKTIAFLLPLFRQIKDQRPLENMEGPMAIVMTPTRELAVQIHRECKPFLKALGLRAVAAYGGSPIKDQIAEMKKGTEIIVCTPGRMIDLLTANSGRVTNLKRVTYLVLDEADRMFDMGFEPQVMKIVNNIRPDRQTVLFSATFPKQMDSLARKILTKPLEITVGGRSVVAAEIEQIVEVRAEDTKFNRLLEILGQTYYEEKDSRTLIFVDRQEAADDLLRMLIQKGYLCMSLHGGKDQVDRDQTIADFKSGACPIVTATSVAARGLDVKQLTLVINYDVPNHMEDYVHRAGRTGRAGNKGTCVTFITPEQERYSVDVWRALQASGASVPPELEAMATGFLEKVKAGKARQFEGSGFGGKGLERFDQERDAKEKAERNMFGAEAGVDDKAATSTATAAAGATGGEDGKEGAESLFDFKVEIKRGPAPESSKTGVMPGGAASSKQSEAVLKARQIAAKLGSARGGSTLVSTTSSATPAIGGVDEAGRKGKDPDATDFHAIIPINDYPQKARWKVTNKETMVQLIDITGASVTNKGIYYDAGKEPGPGAPPKLHLLIESNDEYRVEQAVREIRRLLIEASTAALQAEARNPTATGRYSVV